MECEVEVKEGELRIKDLRIRDEEVVDHYSDLEEDETCRELEMALKMGTIALKSIKVSEKVDYIKKEFNKLDHRFDKSLDEILEHLEQYIGEDGKLPEKIEEFFGEDGRIIHEIFDPDRDGTPLNQMKNEIIQSMYTMIKEEEREKSKPTEIGGDFEGFVEQGLSDVIKYRRNCSDILRNTANERGLMDKTTGDFVIDVDGRESSRLVVEVKDHQTISSTQIKENMEEAIENRGASYGIFINKNVEGLPNYMGWFHDYPKDNYLVCALTSEDEDRLHEEMLHMAYQWGRTKTLQERAEAEGIDISSVEGGMDEIREGIEKVSNLRRKYTNIENSVDDMREISRDIESFVERGLSNIQDEINKAMEV